MILGVNGIRLVSKRSGVGRAIEAILHCLGERQHPFSQIRVYTPKPLDKSIKLPEICHNVVLPAPSWLPPALWEQFILLWGHGRQELLFCPSYVMPLLASCPTVVAHHGSYEGYAEAAEAYSWWARTKAAFAYKWSARRATRLSTVSHSSKRDMIHFYNMPPERIEVIPEGVDTKLFRPINDKSLLAEWRQQHFGADIPFLLYVGKPTKRRNLPNLLKAFAKLKQKKWTHKLLLIGTSLPGTSFESEIESLGLTNEVIAIGYASQEEIALAYNASDMLIYPSSYEGFGMPVLEAMACGTPVIALNNTAFPEFAGGVASLLPDAEVESLINGIQELLSSQAQQEQMRRAGVERAADYDWHLITQRYIELMLEALHDK